MLQQADLFETLDSCPVSSLEVRHARTSAQPAKARASMAAAQCFTSKPCGSCEKCDPFGVALRIAIRSELVERTGCSMNWNQTATPLGRSWWALGTPERRTEGNEAGSLLPTPQKHDAVKGYAHRHGRSDRIAGRANLNDTIAYLATPTCRDWKSGKASEATHNRNSRPLSEQLGKHGLHGTELLKRIVGWMMGFPPGWLSKPTATPLSRKSPKR